MLSLASVGFLDEVLPAPAVFANAEKHSHKRARRFDDTKKSSRSMIVEPAPIGWIFFSRLNPNTAGIVSTSIITRFTISDFFLLQSHSSTDIVIMFSNTAITVESAANTINRKNSAPHQRPPGMWVKTLAIVSNSRLGPAVTSRS